MHVAPAALHVLEHLSYYHRILTIYQDSPLATNLNYSAGQAQITVPNVPTRSDYIVVCKWLSHCYMINRAQCPSVFGDSGNASPEFTIINDASSSTSVVPSSVPTSPPGSTSPDGSAPGSTPPGNAPSLSGSPTAGVSPTATTPTSQTTSHTSTVVVAATTTPSSTQSSAAWRKHVPNLGSSLGIALTFIYFAFS